MTRTVLMLATTGLFALSGCAQGNLPGFLRQDGGGGAPGAPLDAVGQPGSSELSDEVREVVTAPAPPAEARTAEDFDTTTAEQRAAATSSISEPAAEVRLGETVASLGDPSQSGFWIKTPLARKAGPGRLENPANGKSALVELIPLEGPATGGSQVSLAALRVLEAPITDLPTLVVYAN